MKYTFSGFASTYGQSTYNSSTYQNGSVNSTTSTNTGSTAASTASASGISASGGANLANTGFDLLLAATLGLVIVFSALVIRFWKKPKKTTLS